MLIVEDSDEDFESIRWAFWKSGVARIMNRCTDGEDALDYLCRRGRYSDPAISPRPSLIWLDLNLPGTSGQEVLEHIKGDEGLKAIPTLVVTTSSNQQDIELCYRRGANSYIVKPLDLDRLAETVKQIDGYWFGTAVLLERSAR